MHNPQAMPPENPALVGAMEAVGYEDNVATRQALYEALFEAVLIIGATGGPAEEGWVTYQPGARVQLVTFQTQDGRTIWPVFTDMGQMQMGRLKADRYLAILGFDMLHLAWRHQIDVIHINPGGLPTALVHDWEIAELAQGLIPQPAGEGADVVELDAETSGLVTPPDPPLSETEIESIGRAVKEFDAVEEAYVFMLEMPSEGAPTLTLGAVYVALPEAQIEKHMVNNIVQILAPELGRQMNYLRLDDRLLEAIREYAVLVYRRL